MSNEQQEGAEPVTCEDIEPPATEPRILTREEEVSKQAQETFDYFDSDKSGYIDAKDVENYFRKWNDVENNVIILTEDKIKEYAAQFLQELDGNADGKVTFDEIYNIMLKESECEVA